MPAQISLAGHIAVTIDDRRTDESMLPAGQKRVALALLVCERHRPITREELAHNLWPRARPATWRTALRGVVAGVRRFLVAAGLGDGAIVRARAGTYRLHAPDGVRVDIERAAEAGAAATDALRTGPEHAGRAGKLAAGARAVLARPLLPGADAPWLDAKRRELSQALITTSEVLAEARLVLGQPDRAVRAAEQTIALDGFRESAHRLIMRAHAAAGNVAAGLRAFERCRRLLADELGAVPDPRTRALHETMLAGDPPPGRRPARGGGGS